jgi:hypothetical protein
MSQKFTRNPWRLADMAANPYCLDAIGRPLSALSASIHPSRKKLEAPPCVKNFGM